MWSLAVLLALGLSTQSADAKSVVVGRNQKLPFSLEEIFDSAPKPFAAGWLSSKEIEYKNRTTGDVMVYNAMSNSTSVLLDASVLKAYNATWYRFSPDKAYVLIGYDERRRYRHSAYSKFVVYSLRKKTYADVADKRELQHAAWSPKQNSVLFILDNTMYYIEDVDAPNKVYPVSRKGTPNVIFHGITDWVYEEEILGSGVAYTFSPSGRRILYLTLDDGDVTETTFTTYGEPGSLKDQYAGEERLRYPKPGTPISKFEVWHFDLADKTGKRLSKFEGYQRKSIINGWKWVTDDTVAVTYSNRVQNVTETYMCDVRINDCLKAHEDANSRGWANLEAPLFHPDGQSFVMRGRSKVGGVEYYQVHMVFANGTVKVLTRQPSTVSKIIGWDRDCRLVYYKSSLPGEPSTDHVFAVSEHGGLPACITCGMASPEGVPCKSATVKFNQDFSKFIGYCHGPTPTVVAVYNNNVGVAGGSVDANPNRTAILDDSSRVRKLLSERLLPKVMNLKVNVTEEFQAEVRLLLPPDVDVSGSKKYPLLIYVYGGPENDQIHDAFHWSWNLYLTTNRSVICGFIDGRGTARKGTDMMYAVYRALGTHEVQDQITATRYVRDNFAFVDKKRIGIWGWSYGGYATVKALEYDTGGVFKCGVSVAPVTDWIYYNSAYTERYMGLPSDNRDGYRRGSVLYNVKNLQSKKFLLMHGTGDDNVHFQHAMHLATVLQRKNIMFGQQMYPDEAHGISGSKYHVYCTMLRFWEDCFDLP